MISEAACGPDEMVGVPYNFFTYGNCILASFCGEVGLYSR